MDKVVYVVHCVDTEGPLYEAPEVPFTQIKKVFGIEIPPTEANLVKLQKGELDLGGLEHAVMNLVDVHKMSINMNWEILNQSIQFITADDFRRRMPDSFGNGWIFSWFCLDHVGFEGENPRRRDAGHHKVFDRYIDLVIDQDKGDIVQFHHHPVSHSGNYHECGTAYWGRETLNDILTRKVIDRSWFPTAFRPGFHTERPDSNWFLEQWIPFDYGNQSVKGINTNQPDLANGRFGDWRRAPLEWKPYHPSYDDYQKKGSCHRWLTRCLNMYARLREITQEDVLDAFQLADVEGKALLAFTDHDFKDMKYDILRMQGFIKEALKEFPDIKFQYVDAITAIRKCCDLEPMDLMMECELIENVNNTRLEVTVRGELFGAQPYLALKTNNGKYIWDNFDFDDNKKWSYTFDRDTIIYDNIASIGVAANNPYGKCEIMNFDKEKMNWIRTILN